MTAHEEDRLPRSAEAPPADPQTDEGEALYLKKRESRLRRELARRLSQSGPIPSGVMLLNMESGETLHFDSYPEALKFMQGKKGRWYLSAHLDHQASKRAPREP